MGISPDFYREIRQKAIIVRESARAICWHRDLGRSGYQISSNTPQCSRAFPVVGLQYWTEGDLRGFSACSAHCGRRNFAVVPFKKSCLLGVASGSRHVGVVDAWWRDRCRVARAMAGYAYSTGRPALVRWDFCGIGWYDPVYWCSGVDRVFSLLLELGIKKNRPIISARWTYLGYTSLSAQLLALTPSLAQIDSDILILSALAMVITFVKFQPVLELPRASWSRFYFSM